VIKGNIAHSWQLHMSEVSHDKLTALEIDIKVLINTFANIKVVALPELAWHGMPLMEEFWLLNKPT
jgi:hypothetical protein